MKKILAYVHALPINVLVFEFVIFIFCGEKMKKVLSFNVLPFLLLLMLSACGGGSGGSDPDTYTVMGDAGVGGDISPRSVTVEEGEVTSFTITPDSGNEIGNVSGCGGSLSGNTYTTSKINANCTVTANFVDILFDITTVVGMGGSITPTSTTVNVGGEASFAITPDEGYDIQSVSGCNGSLSGLTFTVNNVNSDCVVSLNFIDNPGSVESFEVSATTGPGGTVSPNFISVVEGETAMLTITPDSGFYIDEVDGCNGLLQENSYLTGPVTENCNVTVSFSSLSEPSVDAGVDQVTQELTEVVLSGSAMDVDGDIQGYLWSQVSGPAVTLVPNNTPEVSFTAPNVTESSVLVFMLTATDNDGLSVSDTVEITVENSAGINNTNVVAATGMPAADFPEGFIYWSLFKPSIGASGHIAFRGAADVSAGQTSQNTAAIWYGFPDNLRTIIRENDTLPRLPSNVLYAGSRHDSTGTQSIKLSMNGYASDIVRLKGAVNENNDQALIVYANNVLHTVIRTGDQAPGFPEGHVITSDIFNHALSDAGVVFTAMAQNPSDFTSTLGIWYWDFNNTTLIAASRLLGNPSVPQQFPGLFSDDCEFFFANSLIFPQINNRGDIAFVSNLYSAGDDSCPDSPTLLQWNANTYTALLSEGDAVDNLTGFQINLGYANIFPAFNLFDSGDISLSTTIFNPSISDLRGINWVIKANGNQEYLSIGDEFLPGSTSARMNKNLGTFGFGFAPKADMNGNYLVGTIEGVNVESVWLLKGPSRPMPYSDISEIASSQLDKVVKQGDIPPGYTPTAFFSSITLLFNQGAPSINAQGNIVFYAARSDALEPNVEIPGLWLATPTNDISPLLEYGDQVTLNGVAADVIGFIFGTNNGNVKGTDLRHSDSGQIILPAVLSNANQAILLITP